jgi:hypothetical protein
MEESKSYFLKPVFNPSAQVPTGLANGGKSGDDIKGNKNHAFG